MAATTYGGDKQRSDVPELADRTSDEVSSLGKADLLAGELDPVGNLMLKLSAIF